MGSRAITPDLYERLVSAFRQDTNIAKASRVAGCSQPTAKKAWHKAWPRKGFKPIADVMREEQIAARAKLAAEHAARLASQQKEREDARQQAIQSRQQEGQMIVLGRTNALQATAVAGGLLKGARALAAEVQKQLDDESKKAPADRMPAGQRLALIQRILACHESVVRAAHEQMRMERLFLGQPTDIIAHIDLTDTSGEMTTADLEVRAAGFLQALHAHQRRRALMAKHHNNVSQDDAVDGQGERIIDVDPIHDNFDEDMPGEALDLDPDAPTVDQTATSDTNEVKPQASPTTPKTVQT